MASTVDVAAVSFDDEMRQTIEQQAWKRPVLCAKQLKDVRIQTRLMDYDGKGRHVVEIFIHTGEKEIDVYVP